MFSPKRSVRKACQKIYKCILLDGLSNPIEWPFPTPPRTRNVTRICMDTGGYLPSAPSAGRGGGAMESYPVGVHHMRYFLTDEEDSIHICSSFLSGASRQNSICGRQFSPDTDSGHEARDRRFGSRFILKGKVKLRSLRRGRFRTAGAAPSES